MESGEQAASYHLVELGLEWSQQPELKIHHEGLGVRVVVDPRVSAAQIQEVSANIVCPYTEEAGLAVLQAWEQQVGLRSR